ncbi:carboxypeptidase B-like [Achroia grisella]|uniref:carboxypeptidase B-like n=1 Tax=Achroia grisella TaxID=688607 RepID=UPI0027D2358F|nr:carboxypeptidase B-like [Achroia grisella]
MAVYRVLCAIVLFGLVSAKPKTGDGLIALEKERLAEAAKLSSNRTESGSIALDRMYNYDEIVEHLTKLAADHDTVTLRSEGRTFEGQVLRYIEISTTDFMDRNKPVILIQSLIHAREWISLPATLYAINKLVTDITEQDLVNDIDWIIVPVVNPDGYEFSRTTTRHWLKNRYRDVNNECVGVNINRNFRINFRSNSSNNDCSDFYHGEFPTSEEETLLISDIIATYRQRLQLFLDFQSYGSQILYGYGSGALPNDVLLLHFLGIQMANAINNVQVDASKNYFVGHVASFWNYASGTAIDYAKEVRKIPYSFTIKLPSYGDVEIEDDGYLVDPTNLEQAGKEAWEAIKVSARFIRDTYQFR